MKFLMVHDYQDYVFGNFEPLGIMYIMTAARNAGHQVRIVQDKFDKVCSVMEEWEPDFVGYGPYTGYHQNLIDFNRRLKERYAFTSIFGGPHATFFPEIIENEGVDIVCRGEGEAAIAEALDKAEKGEDYSEVPNLWVKRNGMIHKNMVRALQPVLEEFDFPARDLFYTFPNARDNKVKVLITARGCPYSCSYCYNYKIKELYKDTPVKHLRHRKVEAVIEEIDRIRADYPLDFIYFGTDCFAARKDWVLEFSEQYRRAGHPPFLCISRPETINPEVCRALKSAGCVTIGIGIEAGDQQLRYELLNRRMSDEQIIKAADEIHRAGLKMFSFNIMGFPGETYEQCLKTMYINQKCRSDMVTIFLFQPYPRTKLADYAVEHGYFSGDYDHLSSSWFLNSPIDNKDKKRIERLLKIAPLGVEFPWLTPVIKFGTRLPLNLFYFIIARLFKSYCYRMRIMPVKIGFRKTLRLILDYVFDFGK